MDSTFLDKVLTLHGENNWEKVLQLNANSDDKSALKILWVWPSETNLKFLKSGLYRFKIQGVTSIGCGCGLLEWIIQKYTDLPVVGYEINKEWWQSKYSVPPFIPLKYVEEQILLEFNPDFALLFCYFNNGPAFREYVRNYRGSMIIIIGPHHGSGRHTDPQPFCTDFGGSKWRLVQQQEVKDTKDFIAVYLRQECLGR